MLENELFIFSVISFLTAALLSFASTPLVRIFAKRIGAVDVPRDSRRMHSQPIPRLGGLAIFMGFLFSVLLWGRIDSQMRGILLGAVIIVFLGVIDDIVPIPALVKLFVQIVAALIPVSGGVVIQVLSNPNVFSDALYLNLGVLSVPVTVLWIVGITNAVNLIDGLDGLAVGVSSIATFSLFAVAVLVSEPYVAIVLAALAGACIGFMPYNLNPATIFMGDTGATFLGFILATVSIQGLFKFYAVVSFAVPFLILGLPIFDTLFAITRRLLSGKSPMTADRGHVHHRLMDMGFNQKQAVAILYVMSGILGLSAVVLTTSGEIKAMILILAVIAAVAIGGKALEYFNGENGSKNGKTPHSSNQNDGEDKKDE